MPGCDPGSESPGFILFLNLIRNEVKKNPGVAKRFGAENDEQLVAVVRKEWENLDDNKQRCCQFPQKLWEDLAQAARQGAPPGCDNNYTPGFLVFLNYLLNNAKNTSVGISDADAIAIARARWIEMPENRKQLFEAIAVAANQDIYGNSLVDPKSSLAGEKRRASSPEVGPAEKKKVKFSSSNKKKKGKVPAASKKKKKAPLASKKRKKAAPLTNKKRKSKAPVADKKRKKAAPAASKKKKAKIPGADKKKKKVVATAAKKRKPPVAKRR